MLKIINIKLDLTLEIQTLLKLFFKTQIVEQIIEYNEKIFNKVKSNNRSIYFQVQQGIKFNFFILKY